MMKNLEPKSDLFSHDAHTQSIHLYSPTSIPNASGYLWNASMMLQMTCRGYASAQHMQPEPSKYSYGQSIEATTFMQPEHHYHSAHPGRFFFVKVNGGEAFSIPYEPMRVALEQFRFTQAQDHLAWNIVHDKVEYQLKVSLGDLEAAEIWTLTIINQNADDIDVDLYPCFSIGYLSWMNQSADFDAELNGIIANYVTPYQKIDDYYKNKHLLDNTILLAEQKVIAYDANLKEFEGEGGFHNPKSINNETLQNSSARYETPIACLQHKVKIVPRQQKTLRWVFAPAADKFHARKIAEQYFSQDPVESCNSTDNSKLNNRFVIRSEDETFNHFVNTWLPRQMRYHCQSNRLTRDPQTRNFLQDHMVEVFDDPINAKQSILFALSQQSISGAMPDGLLLAEDAQLKYINQIPHSDHNIWLFIYLDTYLAHGNDLTIFEETVEFKDLAEPKTVFEHLQLAAEHLLAQLDHRKLSLIQQGDWCDPMNMVGKEGKGVSIWLSMATAYAFDIFADICEKLEQYDNAKHWLKHKTIINNALNKLAWDGQWYARGICDNGRTFGIKQDQEGKIYLNPQSWSLLCGAADEEKTVQLLEAVDKYLDTPYGCMMLSPAYTKMDEDIGRLTQKFPGSAENGSVYNHAACFYAFALLKNGHANKGYQVLRKMLVDDTNILAKQQLPNFIPNYYRGAYHQYPDVAGRSSHLFNTGSCAWYYRCVIECIFGITNTHTELHIQPCMCTSLGNAQLELNIFGATVLINYIQNSDSQSPMIVANTLQVHQHKVSGFKANRHYEISVHIS